MPDETVYGQPMVPVGANDESTVEPTNELSTEQYRQANTI